MAVDELKRVTGYVPVIVVPKQSAIFGRHRVRTSDRVRTNADEIVAHLWRSRPSIPIYRSCVASYAFVSPYGTRTPSKVRTGRLYVPKDTRPDLGNLVKQADDCLERARIVVDDSRIVGYREVGKWWGPDPGFHYSIEELPADEVTGVSLCAFGARHRTGDER